MSIKVNPIGIYEKAIPNQFTWKDKIRIAKAAGYNFIEMSVDESDERLSRLNWTKSERQDFVNLLEEEHFSILSMCLSGHRRFPFGSEDETTRNKAYEIMEKAIELASDLGIKNIQLAGYDVYYEDSSETTIKRFVEGLKYSAKKAEEANVMLTIEIMDTYLCGTIERTLEFVKIVNSDHLKIYPDLGNLTQWSNTPCMELQLGFDYIEAIHLKDTKDKVFKLIPFGEGDVDFRSLFYTLNELDYKKPFLVEMWANNDKAYTMEESIEEIKNAKDWLLERM
jgi:L-ribulose-5-phosphate 3-epimerase/hexulose-6-phosphate isomerase